jgi:GGDEF domain-containing protein
MLAYPTNPDTICVSGFRQPSVAILMSALAAATAAVVLLRLELTAPSIAATSLAAAAIAVELVRVSLPQRHVSASLLARLVSQAQAGRKLAIYDRETGLFAHWYVGLRGQEEVARAARYTRKLSLLIIEPRTSTTAGEWAVKSEIGQWIQNELRASDIAGYLGNGRYIVLVPEANAAAIDGLIGRLRQRIPPVDIASSEFPDDGLSFEDLWRSATLRLLAHGVQPREDAA